MRALQHRLGSWDPGETTMAVSREFGSGDGYIKVHVLFFPFVCVRRFH